jgi:Mu transposase, C-terminal domain
LKVRPVDRLADEQLAPLPAAMPDCARRWVTRVAPDPYLRVDTNDYSLEPGLVGRRVEVIVDQQHVTAVALDTGEVACRHRRIFARHRTLTAFEHARALRAGRDDRRDSGAQVQIRPLDVYDRLIA